MANADRRWIATLDRIVEQDRTKETRQELNSLILSLAHVYSRKGRRDLEKRIKVLEDKLK